MTLSEMYEAVKEDYDWPDQEDFLTEFDPDRGGDYAPNRGFLNWFREVMLASVDATMQNACYSVIREKWPAHDGIPAPSCGNWDASECDGEIDDSGWYTHVETSQARQVYPRGITDHQPGYDGSLLAECNNDLQYFGVMKQKRFGQADCPILYPLKETQLDGSGGLSQGHRQPSAYLPSGHPDDDSDDVNHIRVLRHDVEAIINSGTGGREVNLAPWVAEITQFDPFDYYQGERTFRWLAAMLRAKNVPQITFWVGEGGFVSADAWDRTRKAMKEVYAAEVEDLSLVVGQHPYSPGQFGSDLVEYTLRVGGVEKTFDNDAITEQWLDGYHVVVEAAFSGLDLPPDVAISGYDYEIVLECSVSEPDVTTQIHVFDFANLEWDKIGDYEGGEFPFYTTDHSMRRTFYLPHSGGGYVSSGSMAVRVLHQHYFDTFRSKIDLVQVIPVPYFTDSSSEEESMMRSDLNFDGQSDTQDLEGFALSFGNGAALADINHDGAVNAEDTNMFLEAYVNGE